MNQDAIVHLLEPLRQPPPVSVWPPAPGWWIVSLMLIVLLVFSARWLLRRYRDGAAVRAARKELRALQNKKLEPAEFCERLASLQRRVVASKTRASADIATTGKQWADVLNALAPGVAPFDTHLVTLHYAPTVSMADKTAAMDATERWLSAVRRS